LRVSGKKEHNLRFEMPLPRISLRELRAETKTFAAKQTIRSRDVLNKDGLMIDFLYFRQNRELHEGGKILRSIWSFTSSS